MGTLTAHVLVIVLTAALQSAAVEARRVPGAEPVQDRCESRQDACDAAACAMRACWKYEPRRGWGRCADLTDEVKRVCSMLCWTDEDYVDAGLTPPRPSGGAEP